MGRILAKATAGLIIAFVLNGTAHAQFPREHVISVSGSDRVLARPDLGILILAIRSSAPLAADAVQENARKVASVRFALAKLGYSSADFKVTSVVFTRSRRPYRGSNQPSVTEIEASQFIYIFFGGEQLKDQSQFGRKIATLIDALPKSEAPATSAYSQDQTSMIVYTIKDPAKYEAEALQRALGAARETAQAIAKEMGTEITGLASASANSLSGGVGGGVMMYPQPQTLGIAQGELPYHWYSTRADQVAISATATVHYGFK